MFRKYYKEANNDIKPNEEFVNSVIKNATRKRPPSYKRYTKYAASLAAAVVVASAAVISMPLWQRVIDREDDVIIDSVALATAEPESAGAESPQDSAANAGTPPESTSNNSYTGSDQKVSSDNESITPKAAAERPPQTAGSSVQVPEKAQTNETETNGKREEELTEGVEADGGAAQENSAATPPVVSTQAPVRSMKQVVESESVTASVQEDSADTYSGEPEFNEAVMYSRMGGDISLSSVEEADNAEVTAEEFHDDYADAPAPSGYYCTSASWNSYTFENDSGAVIYVTISYGGEDSEAEYSVDGDYICATYGAYGMNVIINAYGAEMETVEEIIDLLR